MTISFIYRNSSKARKKVICINQPIPSKKFIKLHCPQVTCGYSRHPITKFPVEFDPSVDVRV